MLSARYWTRRGNARRSSARRQRDRWPAAGDFANYRLWRNSLRFPPAVCGCVGGYARVPSGLRLTEPFTKGRASAANRRLGVRLTLRLLRKHDADSDRGRRVLPVGDDIGPGAGSSMGRARSYQPIRARGSPCARALPRRVTIPCQQWDAECRFGDLQRARRGCPPLPLL
jgi:hypothetical protein